MLQYRTGTKREYGIPSQIPTPIPFEDNKFEFESGISPKP